MSPAWLFSRFPCELGRKPASHRCRRPPPPWTSPGARVRPFLARNSIIKRHHGRRSRGARNPQVSRPRPAGRRRCAACHQHSCADAIAFQRGGRPRGTCTALGASGFPLAALPNDVPAALQVPPARFGKLRSRSALGCPGEGRQSPPRPRRRLPPMDRCPLACDDAFRHAVRRGHKGWVTAIATPLDPSSDTILSASRDKTVIMWHLTREDTDYGIPKRALRGHSHFVEDVVISSDGQFALSGSWDGTLRLWDLSTGATARRFVDHKKASARITMPKRGWSTEGRGGHETADPSRRTSSRSPSRSTTARSCRRRATRPSSSGTPSASASSPSGPSRRATRTGSRASASPPAPSCPPSVSRAAPRPSPLLILRARLHVRGPASWLTHVAPFHHRHIAMSPVDAPPCPQSRAAGTSASRSGTLRSASSASTWQGTRST